MKRVLITGITGMDGSYLAKLYLESGHEVWGGVRRSSNNAAFSRLDFYGITDRIKFTFLEMLEYENIRRCIETVKPDIVLHMAAQSFVKASFELPLYTADVTALGTLRLLEAIRQVKQDTKFYFAGSSEQFGRVLETPQTETTPFNPRSPYAVDKVFGYHVTRNYRDSYGMFASNGLLFNHEGRLRGLEFVPRKITHAVARIHQGLQKELVVGNLNAQRDWGHNEDFCKAIVKIMDHSEPDDFVIATNTLHSVREFIETAFACLGIKISWIGSGIEETGVDTSGQVLVRTSQEFYRPSEVELLRGDYSKAKRILGWEPQTSLDELVQIMVQYDQILALNEREGKHGIENV